MLSAEPKAGTDNTHLDLNYLGYTKLNFIIVLLYIVLKRITTITPDSRNLN